jgi:hypothetical protein
LRGEGLDGKINIAIIGAGGRGAANTQSASRENIVALTEANPLGNVAYRTGKKLDWVRVKLQAKTRPRSDRLIRKPYHQGWTR